MSVALAPVVAVCTCERPALLARLVTALLAQDGIAEALPILVIDNAPDGSASTLTAQWPQHEVRILHVPDGGVVAARNRALEEAPAGRAVIFIDDDEDPMPGWYRAFAERHTTQPDVVLVGPVHPRFTGPVPVWAQRFGVGTRPGHADGAEVALAGGGNALLPPALIGGAGLRFSPAFTRCGGEDTDLFLRWQDTGGRIRWVEAAAVDEAVPPSRLTAGYQIRRSMWGAAGYTKALASRRGGRWSRVVRLPAHIGRAFALAVFGVLTGRRDRLVGAGVQLARAVGTVRALVGWMPDRYRAYRDDVA